MTRVFIIGLCLMLVVSLAAQDSTFHFWGSGDCETVVTVSDNSSQQTIYVELQHGDEILAGGYVPTEFRLPVGVQPYTLTVQHDPNDAYAYSITVHPDCPMIDPALSDEEWLAQLSASVSPYAPSWLDASYLASVSAAYGRDEAARRVQDVNEAIAWFLALQPTQPPETLPTPEPTDTPTPNATIESTP